MSIGSLDRSIREVGFACRPVVEALIKELQTAELLHLDETPWYESGRLCWLWVVLSSVSVVFFIGPRTKERLLQVISTAFVGWLVTDGYGAYRWYDHRQRYLAHLIRKVVDAEVRQLGQWLLEEMRELIQTLATNEAEPALRHAVIARHITHGTRSTEGSDTYAALLTVIETCRRRNRSP